MVNSELLAVIAETVTARLSLIRQGDQQGFSVTDDDSAKVKTRRRARELRRSATGARGHHVEERDRHTDC